MKLNVRRMRRQLSRNVPDRWTIKISQFDDYSEEKLNAAQDWWMHHMRVKHQGKRGRFMAYKDYDIDNAVDVFTFEFTEWKDTDERQASQSQGRTEPKSVSTYHFAREPRVGLKRPDCLLVR